MEVHHREKCDRVCNGDIAIEMVARKCRKCGRTVAPCAQDTGWPTMCTLCFEDIAHDQARGRARMTPEQVREVKDAADTLRDVGREHPAPLLTLLAWALLDEAESAGVDVSAVMIGVAAEWKAARPHGEGA